MTKNVVDKIDELRDLVQVAAMACADFQDTHTGGVALKTQMYLIEERLTEIEQIVRIMRQSA